MSILDQTTRDAFNKLQMVRFCFQVLLFRCWSFGVFFFACLSITDQINQPVLIDDDLWLICSWIFFFPNLAQLKEQLKSYWCWVCTYFYKSRNCVCTDRYWWNRRLFSTLLKKPTWTNFWKKCLLSPSIFHFGNLNWVIIALGITLNLNNHCKCFVMFYFHSLWQVVQTSEIFFSLRHDEFNRKHWILFMTCCCL